MSKTVIIRNVEFHFANLMKSHAPFGEEIWDVQIRVTDEDTIKTLKELGVNMKPHDDGYHHANVKRRVKNRKGDANTPVVVVDAQKNPWNPTVNIGHGSTGHIKLFSFDYNVGGRSGTGAMLSAVQVVDLVEYKGSDGVDFDVEGDAPAAPDSEDF